jgi:hypothetical protein
VHPDVVGWAEKHRGDLIWACLVLIRAWLRAGKPMSARKPFGTFQQWADVMGSILDHVGIPGLIGNMEEALRTDDVMGDVWRRFVGEWARVHKEAVVASADLFEIAKEIEDFPWGKAVEDGQRKAALTRQLRARKDRVVGQYKITFVTNDQGVELHTGGHLHFQLLSVAPPPPGEGEDPPTHDAGQEQGEEAAQVGAVGERWSFSAAGDRPEYFTNNDEPLDTAGKPPTISHCSHSSSAHDTAQECLEGQPAAQETQLDLLPKAPCRGGCGQQTPYGWECLSCRTRGQGQRQGTSNEGHLS